MRMKMDKQPNAIRTHAKHDATLNRIDGRADRSLRDSSAYIDYPASWYYFGSVKEVQRRPVTRNLLGKRLVAFLTESGQPGVLESSCVHMGSDLGGGCVVGESLQCSLHHWRFDPQGRCTMIPTAKQIPSFARQTSFPAAVRHGNIYFFFGAQPLFPLPFFEGLETDQLVAARPFVDYLDCPWYMVGANAVDVQHFAIAHDRRMERRPEVDHPHPHAHRTVCHFEVAGNSLGDQITRRLGGANVRLQVTDWSSTMIFARSTLAKTESFGIVSVVPLGPTRTLAHVTVMAHASKGPLRRKMLDPLRARVRRSLISKVSEIRRASIVGNSL